MIARSLRQIIAMFNSQPYCWVQPITSVEPMLMLGCHISVTCNNRTSHQAGDGCMDSPTIDML